ncbi:MAG: S24 family peptidase [Shimia sp.]
MSEREFATIVRARLEELGETPFSFEKRYDLPTDAVRNAVREDMKSGPRLQRISQLADALGYDFYFGPPREVPQPVALDPDDYVFVPRYDAALSAGPGAQNEELPPHRNLAFRRAWFHDMRLNEASCILLSVSGYSMFPLLSDGDVVMLDRAKTTVRRDQVYGLLDPDGQAIVKRLRPTDTGLILKSDNPEYDPRILSKDEADRCRILGQVVWSGHAFPE